MSPAAVLDIDGTLVDTNYHHAIAWYRAFRQHGELLPDLAHPPAYRHGRRPARGARSAATQVEEEKGDDIRSAEKALYMALIEEVEPLHGARELIVDLKESGHAVVLASSAKADEVEHYLDLLDARELADGWTTSADVEATKPEPDLVVAALEKAGSDERRDGRRLDLRLRGRRARRDRDDRRAHGRLLRAGAARRGRRSGLPFDRRAARVARLDGARPRSSRQDSCRGGPARQLPGQARLREDPGAQGARAQEDAGAALRRAGAQRPSPALGPAPRARRHARLLGAAARRPGAPGREPARGPDRGPPARLPRVRGRHPEGRVRRRHDEGLGQRHLRCGEVPRRRGDRDLRRRAPARPLRALPHARQGLAHPPHGPARGPGLPAHAGPARADARPQRQAALERAGLRLRGQVGRHPHDPLLGPRPHHAAGPQLLRLHPALPGGARVLARAGRAAADPRRRGRRLRRAGQAELRAAPVAHAPRLGFGRPPAHARHPGHLRDLRPALPRRPADAAARLRGPAHAARGARARGTVLAHARLPPRRGQRAARGDPPARHRGRDREAPRQPLRARPARLALDQGQERVDPGRRDRRLDAGRGRPQQHDRRARGGRHGGRQARLRRQGRHRLHGGDARAPQARAGAAPARHEPLRGPPAAQGHGLRGAHGWSPAVEFREWTGSGTLRAPSFKGLRPDKDPQECTREAG